MPRFIGLSEMFGEDMRHAMLQQALADDLWDVVMVGFNLLNQTARKRVFARAIALNVGIQIMFAVRKALAHPDHLRPFVDDLVQRGQLDLSDLEDFPDFLLSETDSLPDAGADFGANQGPDRCVRIHPGDNRRHRRVFGLRRNLR